MSKVKKTTFDLPVEMVPDLRKAVEIKAQQIGISPDRARSMVIRVALKEYLARVLPASQGEAVPQ